MSFAILFGVISAACLVAALAALWGSLRAAFGGEGDATFTEDSTPERAALLDEKTALLRAIKDLQYEHQVGKLDQADYERLDRAYRARAKEVLELLDRDVRPYRERAEALVAGATAAPASRTKKKKGSKPVDVAPPVEPKETDATEEASAVPAAAETAAPTARELAEKLDALSPEKRAKAEAFLAQLAQGSGPATADDGPDEEEDDGGGGDEREEGETPGEDRKA